MSCALLRGRLWLGGTYTAAETHLTMARGRRKSRWDYLKAGAFVALVVIATAYFDRLATQDYAGRPAVIDGDSIRLDGIEMRLEGIDAPELTQRCRRSGEDWPCGQAARTHLRTLLSGASVVCSGYQMDRYDRLLVQCRSGESNVNRAMVHDGFAVSFGAYQSEEAKARIAQRGLWVGDFERPASWRDARRGDALIEAEHITGLLAGLRTWWAGIWVRDARD